jgi:release factor glutamine methyltransferase
VAGPVSPPPAGSDPLDEDGRALWAWAVAEVQRDLRGLPDKPEETTVATVRSLWHLAAGERVSARLAMERPLPRLDGGGRDRLRALLARRIAGEPLAHLTGRQSFMGIEMLAGPGALIPRAETELLAGAAVSLLHELARTEGPLVSIDVCTGSANVAASLALAEPGAIIDASDLSADAIDLARRNLEHLGLADRVVLHVGDLLEPFATEAWLGRVTLLTCNPPYISTRRMAEMPTETADHEPDLAFDGGPLGIRILQRLMREAPSYLGPGGWLAVEVGAGQGPAVERSLRSSGAYDEVREVTDGGGEVRVLLAKRVRAP